MLLEYCRDDQVKAWSTSVTPPGLSRLLTLPEPLVLILSVRGFERGWRMLPETSACEVSHAVARTCCMHMELHPRLCMYFEASHFREN